MKESLPLQRKTKLQKGVPNHLGKRQHLEQRIPQKVSSKKLQPLITSRI
ncbi:unnamed protein product [Cylicostephanus goldi]|uniref:Uncharacterized protein n=1 Tax=Cylicostephanus goldi TaxID=71465 RepID=A0A3P6UZY2_CYLGO|nr:unnamed protein product [Cylicostephanus goldi]